MHETDISTDLCRHSVLGERAIRADDRRRCRMPRRAILRNFIITKKKKQKNQLVKKIS